jgi:hypothetical protein
MGWFFKRKEKKALEAAKEEEKKHIPTMEDLSNEEKEFEEDEKGLNKILSKGDTIKVRKK